MTNAVVSIIIPCYNAEPWIGECLDSAIAQTYRPLEIIVIDDGSTDNSLEVIKNYAQQYLDLIRIETGPNRGASAARNRGFALSEGEYVLFLDADDVLEEHTIESLVGTTSPDYREIAFCPSYRLLRNESNKWIKKETTFDLERRKDSDILRILLISSSPPNCALLWQRQLVENINGWDETLSAYQDTDFLWRALLEGDGRLIEIEKGTVYYRDTGSTSISKQNSIDQLRSRLAVLNRVEAMLAKRGLMEAYRISLGQAYYGHAVNYALNHVEISKEFEEAAFRVAGFRSITGTSWHKILVLLLGLRNKLRLSNKLVSLKIHHRKL